MGDQLPAGVALARTLRALGVDNLFTLTGGHIFPILDGAHKEGMRIVDTRHEQTAAFAAEGWARLTRSLGVTAVTAGPGVTNVMSPIVQAKFNGAPVLVLGGRAPAFRWGQGSLQEIDHTPFVSPVAPADTVADMNEIPAAVARAAAEALSAPRRARFLDFPLDILFSTTDAETPAPLKPEIISPNANDVEAIARLIAHSERPVVVAGSNVYLDGADGALRTFVEKLELPVFANGQGRGCVPADHRLSFARSRSVAFKQADLVLVAGAPMDFRLAFGEFGGAKVVHMDSHPDLIASHVGLAASAAGDLDATLAALAESTEKTPDTKEWLEILRAAEEDKRAGAQAELSSDASPIHPMRIYGELVPLLERNAIVIGDGGDFVSYAGREIPSFEAGCWLDPGPYGCLGCGPGYALAARVAYPDRQVVLLLGDGAIGFSGMELETMVRLDLPVVCVVGNNGIWGLEKHPMQALYGYDVAAELRPGIRYDEIMKTFGGEGELVTDPDEIKPALQRAFESGRPYLVNVLTDPAIAYPRSSNLT